MHKPVYCFWHLSQFGLRECFARQKQMVNLQVLEQLCQRPDVQLGSACCVRTYGLSTPRTCPISLYNVGFSKRCAKSHMPSTCLLNEASQCHHEGVNRLPVTAGLQVVWSFAGIIPFFQHRYYVTLNHEGCRKKAMGHGPRRLHSGWHELNRKAPEFESLCNPCAIRTPGPECMSGPSRTLARPKKSGRSNRSSPGGPVSSPSIRNTAPRRHGDIPRHKVLRQRTDYQYDMIERLRTNFPDAEQRWSCRVPASYARVQAPPSSTRCSSALIPASKYP